MHLHLVTRPRNRKNHQISSILSSLSIEISCFNIFCVFSLNPFAAAFLNQIVVEFVENTSFFVAPSVAQSETSFAFRENMLLHLVITIFVADSKRVRTA